MIELRPGGIITVSAPNCVGRTIRVCTLGAENHIGFIGLGEHEGPYLWESTMSSRLRCSAVRHVVQGVQYHPITARLREEAKRGSTVWYYPPTQELTDEQRQELIYFCTLHLGQPYDYWGAFRVRLLCCGWLAQRVLPIREGLGNWFCSEFVAAAFRAADLFYPMNASAWSPVALRKMLVKLEVVGPSPELLVDAGKIKWGE